MKIILKPLGALFLCGAIVVLAILAFRSGSGNRPTDSAPVSAVSASPSPSLTNTVAVAATEGARGHAIYRDEAENGWTTKGWTWAKKVVFDNTDTVHSRKNAIKVEYQSYDGVKFHHAPLDTTPFDRISFYINGGPEGGQKIAVGAARAEKNVAETIMFKPLPAGKWVAVTIPLTTLGLSHQPDMTSFWINGTTGKPQKALYIDEVRLLLPSEPAPSGPALAAETSVPKPKAGVAAQ